MILDLKIFKTYNNEIQLKDDVFYYFGDIVMSGTLVRDENIIINKVIFFFIIPPNQLIIPIALLFLPLFYLFLNKKTRHTMQ